MRTKWMPIQGDYGLRDMALVTRIINKNQLDVTIGFPGWGTKNKTIAYMELPNVSDNRWKSEYRGDELPKRNDCFIVLLSGTRDFNYERYKIIDSYFLAKAHKWLRIPADWEVYAWMDCPKPYKA